MATDYNNGLVKTQTPGGGFGGTVGVDNVRRTFGIGDKVAELAPAESIFFSYLSKLGKKPIDETVWKPLEYRNQWQRRNFTAAYQAADGDGSAGVKVTVKYNNKGKVHASLTYSPIFLVAGQVLRIKGVAWKIAQDVSLEHLTTVGTGGNDDTDSTNGKGTTAGDYILIPLAKLTKVSDNTATFATDGTDNGEGQVIGSQWGEATGAPDGFRDELGAVEFYSQIFKTAVPLMSGSTMATRYRGYANEWKRIYAEHIKAHKMDLENAFLFGYGKYVDQDERFSWGAVPFIENMGGKKYELDYGNTSVDTAGYDVSAPFSYDGIVDVMDDFMAYETGNSGQKLCLTSRKVINALHKVGDGNFVSNSMSGSSAKELFAANLDVKSSSFMPIDVSSISTSWGSMNFVAHPLFRGDMTDKAVCIDLSNVSLRPLAGNGISRDTFVETNVQENDVDGRKDMITTEAGLEILLPETHAVIDFVDSNA